MSLLTLPRRYVARNAGTCFDDWFKNNLGRKVLFNTGYVTSWIDGRIQYSNYVVMMDYQVVQGRYYDSIEAARRSLLVVLFELGLVKRTRQISSHKL